MCMCVGGEIEGRRDRCLNTGVYNITIRLYVI